MKKLFYAAMMATVAISLASCKQEKEAPAIENGVIKLTVVTDVTKTATTDGTHVQWLETDRLGVTDTDHNYEFTPAFQGSVDNGSFEGTVEEAGNYYAYYPYTAMLSEGDPVLEIPATQTQVNGSFDAAADILVSQEFEVSSTTPTVTVAFKRLAAFLKVAFNNQSGVDLSGESISSVTVSLSTETDIAGTVTLDLASADLGEVLAGENSVTVLHPDGLAIDGATMMGVLPFTFPAGCELSIEAQTENYTISKTLTIAASRELAAGHVLPVNVTLAEGDVTYKLQPGSDSYVLVTDVSDLEDGDEILIVHIRQGTETADYAIGTTQNPNNRKAESVTVDGGEIETVPANVQVITLQSSATAEGKWNLVVGEDSYLASAGSKNKLLTSDTVTDNATWTISVADDGKATITASAGEATIIRYNPNTGNGDPLFSCYKSTSSIQNPVFIFRKDSTPANPEYVTQYDKEGLYLGTQERIYTAGTDQLVTYLTGDALTFALLDPAQEEQVVVSGYSTTDPVGTAVTVNVAWKQNKTSVVSGNYNWYVLKVADGKAWIGDAKGRGVIISE
ncbi:MAG: fimbrillin family protein [Bacteroidales bacterium]|nr:fimbrillin family protein [Bacteroidales bacterium]